MSNQKNETMDASSVYTMFEEIKESITELREDAKSAPAPASAESAPALTPEDGMKIETLTEKLNTVSEKLDRPLRHHHTIDFMGNRALIALVAGVGAFIVSLYIIHNQRQTLAQFRDNDLKYRYIQMRGEVTPGDILRFRELFDFNRNPDSIRLLRRQVEQYERLVREQAENEARARLNASEAERLNSEAEQIKNK